MISKAQEGLIGRDTAIAPRAKLSTLERGMLRWAVIDPGDHVLDANIGEGLVAEYIKRNAMCEVCGVSQSIDDVKAARARLRGCDITYADEGDIPWPDGSFDVALIKLRQSEQGDGSRLLGELRRVLKDGGQLILGFTNTLGKLLAERDDYSEAYIPSRRELYSALYELDFTQITTQRAGLKSSVLVAWKQKQLVEEAINA